GAQVDPSPVAELVLLDNDRVGVRTNVERIANLVVDAETHEVLEPDLLDVVARVVAIEVDLGRVSALRRGTAADDRVRRVAGLVGAGRVPAAAEIQRLVVVSAVGLELQV